MPRRFGASGRARGAASGERLAERGRTAAAAWGLLVAKIARNWTAGNSVEEDVRGQCVYSSAEMVYFVPKMLSSFSRLTAIRRAVLVPLKGGAGSVKCINLDEPAFTFITMSRPIATATQPLLKWRKVPRRKKEIKVVKPTNAERRAKLQAELDKLEAEAEADKREAAGDYDFAPLLSRTSTYPPTISSDEAGVRLKDLYESLYSKALAKFEKVSTEGSEKESGNQDDLNATRGRLKNILLSDLNLILTGRFALSEYRFAIQLAAHKTGKSEATHLIRLFSDRHWAAHQGIDHYEEQLNNLFELRGVSEELKAKIQSNLAPFLSAEFRPIRTRCEERLFKEVPKKVKDSYLEEKAAILHGSERPLFTVASGPSMIPTFPAHGCTQVNRKILKEDWAALEIDDLVTYVQPSPNGHTVIACKRITALAGDIAEYKGRKVVIPEGTVWCEGDNKAESYDSRQAGAVPFENLRSRVIASYDKRWHYAFLGRRDDDFWWLFQTRAKAFLGLND